MEELRRKECIYIPIEAGAKTVHNVENEWDSNELCDLFEAKRRVMVRAEFAGCGKSFACKSMEQRGHKVLFVCPTNKLVQNNRENGVTLNHFFGVGMCEAAADRISKFDDSKYDVIVFDEIYFASVRMLAKIKRYSETNPNKIILATGDTDQLETIDLVSDRIDYDTYMNQCIDIIFPDSVLLKENKRLKSQEDKEYLRRFKADIFNTNIPIMDTIKKYFRTTTDSKTTNNIAFKNSTCKDVAFEVRQNLGKPEHLTVGEKLVCRKYLKLRDVKFNVNFEYTIKSVGANYVLEDESIGAKYNLPSALVDKHFIPSYCRTCHSFQGSSIDDEITIFDSDFWFVTRKWVYTAVTRATDLNKVQFYMRPPRNELAVHGTPDGEQLVLCKFLDLKVHNYMMQDKKAGREITDNYVTTRWLKAQYGKTCPNCGDAFRFEFTDGTVESNLTADRIDCSECHHMNNVVPMCVSCNQKKSCWD
jgi:hypothetical protein